MYSVVFGCAMGILFDMIRGFRRIVSDNSVSVFVQDILLWALGTAGAFFFVFVFSGGVLRWMHLVGMFIGWALYYISFGALTWKLFTIIAKPFDALRRLIAEKVRAKMKKTEKKLSKIKKNSVFLFHFPKKKYKINTKYSYALKRRR